VRYSCVFHQSLSASFPEQDSRHQLA
jgi:hypothetical protein